MWANSFYFPATEVKKMGNFFFEDFAEHAYAEGSKVDGLKIILNNP
jgi:hypothetical protein